MVAGGRPGDLEQASLERSAKHGGNVIIGPPLNSCQLGISEERPKDG